MLCVRYALEKIQDMLLHRTPFSLQLRQERWTPPGDIEELIGNTGPSTGIMCRFVEPSLYGTRVIEVKVRISVLAPLPPTIDGDTASQDQSASVRIRLSGIFTGNEPISTEADWVHWHSHLIKTAHHIISPVYQRDRLLPPTILARSLARSLFIERDRFEQALDVRSTRVQLYREGYKHKVFGGAYHSPGHASGIFENDDGEFGTSGNDKTRRIFVALGSNIGNRIENIESACREIDNESDIRIVRTSALYETEPMYVQDQERFFNGACEVR